MVPFSYSPKFLAAIFCNRYRGCRGQACCSGHLHGRGSGLLIPVGIAVLLFWVTGLSAQMTDDASAVSRISGQTMGTTYTIKFGRQPSGEPVDGDTLSRRVKARLKEINRSMSTYEPDSEISRFNRLGENQSLTVSKDFVRVLNRSREIWKLTGGRFDVTVGPLVRFWGFGGGQVPDLVPTAEQVQEILDRTGMDGVQVSSNTITKKTAGLQLDFSAIAKGYAVDAIAEIVGEMTPDYMVEVGGEVRSGGVNPDSDRPWRIGIEIPTDLPVAKESSVAAVVDLKNQAIATSGDYRNFVWIDGKRFQHTIDPVSGYPVDHGVHSVSVVASDCMTADGLATGLMACQLNEIRELCNKLSLRVFVLYENSEGNLEAWSSDDFPGQVLLEKSDQPGTASNQAKTNPFYVVLGTIIVFGLCIGGMAIGVILSNREIKGSCGGLSAMSGNDDSDVSPCSLCTKPASECSRRSGQDSEESAQASGN